jgi:hypothetical protein
MRQGFASANPMKGAPITFTQRIILVMSEKGDFETPQRIPHFEYAKFICSPEPLLTLDRLPLP